MRDQQIDTESDIFITKIGTDSENNALHCIADRCQCCNQEQEVWYFPNELRIEDHQSSSEFYTSSDGVGNVTLNRPEGVTFPAGRFCCGVPDLCVNIG